MVILAWKVIFIVILALKQLNLVIFLLFNKKVQPLRVDVFQFLIILL